MRFTVLGASGFIGCHLVASLRMAGYEVFAPSRGDMEIFQRPLGTVIYAIGVTADFRSRPLDTVKAHVSVLADLFEKADFDSLVYLSSTRLYTGAANGHVDARFSVTPRDPSDLYNLSKLMGETLSLSCGRHGMKVVRLSNVIGTGGRDSENFLFSLVREAQAGKIVLRTDVASAKDYIRIEDVVDLLPRIALHGRATIYNLASGIQVSHGEWASRLAVMTGCTVEVVPGAPRVDVPPIDISLIQEEFGFVARPIFEVLPELLKGERDQWFTTRGDVPLNSRLDRD